MMTGVFWACLTDVITPTVPALISASSLSKISKAISRLFAIHLLFLGRVIVRFFCSNGSGNHYDLRHVWEGIIYLAFSSFQNTQLIPLQCCCFPKVCFGWMTQLNFAPYAFFLLRTCVQREIQGRGIDGVRLDWRATNEACFPATFFLFVPTLYHLSFIVSFLLQCINTLLNTDSMKYRSWIVEDEVIHEKCV